ncbi:MAG: ABC transporter ATP-binding protein [Candidatus Dormibacteraeota bacterium]|nr:ABC transporter ATP-binding protein [Candidatus Dormibacteraeota bacterium]
MADDSLRASIEVRGLTKNFGKLTAVSSLTLSVRAGEVVGFLGPNGAGKTTTIRVLMGFLRPTAGSCEVLGASLGRSPGLRQRVGYLPGDFRVDGALTGRDLLTWFGALRKDFDRRRVDGLAERLHLDLSRRFSELSKGNRQKVGIIQAFMHEPDVLILDEPTSGLDPLMQREFLALVDEAKERGAAVFFSSHVLPEVSRVADRVAIIREGRLVTTSTVDELLDHARHRLELRYSAPVRADSFIGVPGVASAEASGRNVNLTVDGPVGPALAVAASIDGLLRVTSAGDELEQVFVSLSGEGAE